MSESRSQWSTAIEPRIRVGLTSTPSVKFTLAGCYKTANGELLESGNYSASLTGGAVTLEGPRSSVLPTLTLEPVDFETSRVTVHDVTIGVEFHWERRESQLFQGSLVLEPRPDALLVLNELPIESYLVSVISSEMSASCPMEFLRAHAIVSRSWLLAQMKRKESPSRATSVEPSSSHSEVAEIVRWYDRESHVEFDVCADDHCQRYQGISKAFSNEAFDAVAETRGRVLMFGDEICDARYSKSCGGMTEEFQTAWDDRDVPYLTAVYDGSELPIGYGTPLNIESNATEWIESSPPAFCNTRSKQLLERVLPDFDLETPDFYRWRVAYSQEELSAIVDERLGEGIGRIIKIEPVERGKSSRIVKLKIIGERRTVVIGKELEIRRALSRSHLYSSAFLVRAEHAPNSAYPDRFAFIGAGWGHGVGLCQIGAAVMAESGYAHQEILSHYFRGAVLDALY